MVLPLSTAVLSLVDLAVSLTCLFVMLAFDRVAVTPRVAASAVSFCGLLVLALGGGLVLGSLAVRFRDVNAALPSLLQLLFYASPVAYGAEIVPERYRNLFMLNPLAPLLEGLRWSFLNAGIWATGGIAYALAVGIAFFLVGAVVLRRTEQYFADVA
jgi:lipopolysaccharide transport system permease protein